MVSKFWIFANEGPRAPLFRQEHSNHNNGSWSYSKITGWIWESVVVSNPQTSNVPDLVIEEFPTKKKRRKKNK